MDWVQWVIPLIAVGVWILSHLVKYQAEQAKRRPPVQRRRDEDSERSGENEGQTWKRPQSEVERFLEEIRRRRAQTPTTVEAPPPPPPPPPPRRLERPEPPKPRPVPPRRPPRREQPVPVRLPQPQVEEVIVAQLVAPPPVVLEPAPVTPAAAAVKRLVGEPGQMVLQLLKDPRAVRAAFLLREILDRPVSRRRGLR